MKCTFYRSYKEFPVLYRILNQVETILKVSKSSVTDLKSLSSSSIAVIPPDSVPSSPQLPTKTRSFDDRECLRTPTVDVIVTENESNENVQGVDDSNVDESQEQRKSSENISLKCEINEPNINVRQENIAAVLSNASDTNLEANSLLSDGGAKVRSESISLSASPPRITVMCAPCIDDILAETAAQKAEEKIDCDASDSEENAQTLNKSDESIQCSNENDPSKQSIPIQTETTPSNLQLTLEVKKSDEIPTQQEDLSPSMDEYEECNPRIIGDYSYDTITGETLAPGCVAPAPTPAPLIAPLAEIEIDPPDDDITTVSAGIEKSSDICIETIVNPTDDDTTAKPQLQQQQSQTSRTKKKKQKSTDKGVCE